MVLGFWQAQSTYYGEWHGAICDYRFLLWVWGRVEGLVDHVIWYDGGMDRGCFFGIDLRTEWRSGVWMMCYALVGRLVNWCINLFWLMHGRDIPFETRSEFGNGMRHEGFASLGGGVLVTFMLWYAVVCCGMVFCCAELVKWVRTYFRMLATGFVVSAGEEEWGRWYLADE